MSKPSSEVTLRHLNKYYEHISFYVKKELKAEIKQAADDEGKSMRAWMLEAIDEKLRGC